MRVVGTGASRGVAAVALCLVFLGASGAPARPASPSPPARRDIVGTETKLYSQGDEELIIRDFFQDRHKGFFLDVGCAWPIRANNTYYLEDQLEWSGIAIDALPDYAPAWQKKRARSKFFNLLVTDHGGTVETFYRAKDSTGVSSIKPENKKGDFNWEELKVKTTTLTSLLDHEGVTKVDFLSMDIEGAEPLALAGFDIDKFRPELACVEAKAATRQKIVEYFAAHGYTQIERYLKYDMTNFYFTPEGPKTPTAPPS
jgi:FkbM family methyltransferase